MQLVHHTRRHKAMLVRHPDTSDGRGVLQRLDTAPHPIVEEPDGAIAVAR